MRLIQKQESPGAQRRRSAAKPEPVCEPDKRCGEHRKNRSTGEWTFNEQVRLAFAESGKHSDRAIAHFPAQIGKTRLLNLLWSAISFSY